MNSGTWSMPMQKEVLDRIAKNVAKDAILEAEELLAKGKRSAAQSRWFPANFDGEKAAGITVFFDNYPRENKESAENEKVEQFEYFVESLLEGFIDVIKEKEKRKFTLHVVVPKDLFYAEGPSHYGFIQRLVAKTKNNNIDLYFLVLLTGNMPDAGGDALAKGVREMIREIDTPGGDLEEQGGAGDCYAGTFSCRAVLDRIAPVFIWNVDGSGDNKDKWAERRLEVASYDFGGVGLSAPPRLDGKVDRKAAENMNRIVKRSYGACDDSLGKVCSRFVRPNQKWLFLSFDSLLALILIASGIRWLTCLLEPYRAVFNGFMWSLLGAQALISVLLTCVISDRPLPDYAMGILISFAFLTVLGGVVKIAYDIILKKPRAG